MGLWETIEQEYRAAVKERNKELSGFLSTLMSDLKYIRIEKQKELEDEDVIRYLQKSVKQKNEVLEEYKKANRSDLVDKEEKEIAILKKYLPQTMSEQEIQELALKVKNELGATSPADMGKMMKEMMARLKGRADGATVKNIVIKILKE